MPAGELVTEPVPSPPKKRFSCTFSKYTERLLLLVIVIVQVRPL